MLRITPIVTQCIDILLNISFQYSPEQISCHIIDKLCDLCSLQICDGTEYDSRVRVDASSARAARVVFGLARQRIGTVRGYLESVEF